jgi:hypothetical protein
MGISVLARELPAAIATILVVAACAGTIPPRETESAATPLQDPLTISEPPNGATLESETVIIRGTAPPRTRVVRDVRVGQDVDAVSDQAGAWALVVELDPGPNSLRFRLEDDPSTEVDWILTFEPSVADAPSPTATTTATPTAAATATPTAKPTPSPTAVATPPPTAPPTPEAAPSPTPEPTVEGEVGEFFEFDDDLWEIGDEVPPGTYRTQSDPDGCYWARLSGFSGEVDDIISNGFGSGYQVVTIGRRDAGFESTRCGWWTSDLSQVTDSDEVFGEGTFIVGTDIRPGEYRSSEGDGCYWARLSGFGGTIGEVIANDFRSSGRARVRIRSSDEGFTSSRCGTWTRQ